MRAPRLLITVLAVSALIAAGCGDGNEPADAGIDDVPATEGAATDEPADEAAEAQTIRYFTFSAAPDHLETLDAMIAAFNVDHPEITVEVETAPYDDYFTKLQTQLAGGDGADAFELNYENFVSYASKGALADLDTLAAADSSFDAAAYYDRAYEAFQLDGTQYGLPASYSTVVTFYNADLFDAAGLDHPTADWTWAEERAAAEELTRASDDVWGHFAGIQFWEFYKTAAQNGCEFFTDGEVTFDAPECVEALDYMLSYQTDGLQPSDAEMGGVSDGDMFAQGQLGMITTGIWMFPTFADADFTWDIVVEPGNSEKATHFFANGLAVSADSDQQDAAWKWVSFMTGSPEAAQIRVDASWELPTVTDESLFASYLDTDALPANRQAVLDSLNHAIVPPVIERQTEMQDVINAVIERAKAGELTAAEALSEAKAQVEQLLG